jgi:hypothetical protein
MFRRSVLWIVVGALAMPALALAQDRPEGDRSDRSDRRRGFDPAAFREQIETRVKEELAASDDEWKIIQPKLEKVFDARRAGGGGFFGGGFRGSSDRGSSDRSSDRPRSAVEEAQRDLEKTLENKSASADEIKSKIQALREARDKAKHELASAQKDLKDVLTQRQEAFLVMRGFLD